MEILRKGFNPFLKNNTEFEVIAQLLTSTIIWWIYNKLSVRKFQKRGCWEALHNAIGKQKRVVF